MEANCSITDGATGAPAEITLFKDGSFMFFCLPYLPTRFNRAGEANMLVTPWFKIASMIFLGFTRAGFVGSMSGITDVIPSAGQNRAKSGNVERSISSKEMPRWDFI